MTLNTEMSHVRKVVTWVIGRIDRIRPYGMIQGGVWLTGSNIKRYRELVAAGFTPTDEEIEQALKAIQIPDEMRDGALATVKASDEMLCDFIEHGTFCCVSCGLRYPHSQMSGEDLDLPLCPNCSGDSQ